MKTLDYLKFLVLSTALSAALPACSSGSSDEITITSVSTALASDLGVTVLEYLPAPGQFINEDMTATTMSAAVAWAQTRLDSDGGFVSLGAFGGYLTVALPAAIDNAPGPDFGIAGNPFAGNSEPGIVWVMDDTDNNGLPDDTWYELRGGGDSDALRNFTVTYTDPGTPGDVPWTHPGGESGTVSHLPSFHSQNYYPAWAPAASYTLTGTRLPARVDKNALGIWQNGSYPWGYADNYGSDRLTTPTGSYVCNRFSIENAIDATGSPVILSRIRFIRVQSAVLANVPSVGEVSTELFGFKIF